MDTLPSTFDEQDYLNANPDVAAAVRSGGFGSAAEHFITCGRHEGRRMHPDEALPDTSQTSQGGVEAPRRAKILAGLDLRNLHGAEIGALDKPLVGRKDGDIFYIDFSDAETAAAKYRDEPTVDINKLVLVDGLWGDQTLAECVGGRRFDYVVASHVIEHVPDLVTWLKEIESILQEAGELRLAIPDRRFTFDIARVETRIYDVLGAYLELRRKPSPRTMIEYHSLTRFVSAQDAWDDKVDLDGLRRASSTMHGFELAQDSIRNGTYHDTHCWVFTPKSFVQLFLDLARSGFVMFECVKFDATVYGQLEFFAHLKQSASQAAIVQSWEELAASHC